MYLLHMERGVGQGFGDDSLQLDHIIFRQACFPP